MIDPDRRVPPLPRLDPLALRLATIVIPTSYLSHPETVAAAGGAVFPTMRDFDLRVTPIVLNGRTVGMYDDNTTPRWALQWSHGKSCRTKRPDGDVLRCACDPRSMCWHKPKRNGASNR